ncbi:MAG: polysaccharide biosynthesis tyrosine autokinase [Desulfobacterales bacterium]|nr:polysaccharide biosynthesis tyrosine autokinase [Desulfobacterales bacterium]
MAQYDLNLRDYWLVVKKRKFIIIFTILAMGLFSLFFSILSEPVPLYRTSASVKIEKTSSVTGLYIQAISWSQTDDMETQAAVIKSYFIMEMVARKLGLIPADLSSEEVRANKKYLGIILNLKNSAETEQEGYSNIINIIVTSGDPRFAQRLANTIAHVYKEERILDLNKRTIEAKKFIENQLKIVKERLENSEEAVRNFREENKLISLSAQTSNMLGQIAGLQAIYEKSVSDNEKVRKVQKYLEEAKDKPLTSKTSFYINEASSLYKNLNDRLVQLMLKRDTLLLTYTKNYPQVVEINKQISELLENMRSQLFSQEKTVAANIISLKKKIDGMDERIKMLPEKGLYLARLERNVSVNMEVYTLLEKKYQESLIKEAEKIEEVKIVKPALEPAVPINPPKTLATTVVGTIIGLILGIVFAFIIETFDTSIVAIEEVEELLGVPVSGIIPYVSVQEIKAILEEKYLEGLDGATADRHARLVSHFAPDSTLAESFRALRTNLSFTSLEKEIKTVVFTSSSPQEGKTTSVVNLAITMAQAGNKVLIVEGDLRRPVIARMFGLDQTPGLADVILGNYKWRDVIRTITDIMMGKMSMDDIMKTPGMDNLHIITGGTVPPNPAELVSSKSISEFIENVRSEYDMVLIDGPPVLAATDAAILGSKTDGVILVYQVGKISSGTLKRAKAQLDNVKANVIGVVLNGLRAEISPDFAGYDYYKKYYTYGQKEEERKTFWSRLLSIPGFVAGLFRRVSEKRSEKEREDKERSKLKIVVLLIAILFLIIGMLYQADYLRLPGCIVGLFTSRPSDIPVEDNATKVKIIRKKIKKNLSMFASVLPSGEREPEDQKTEKQAPDNRPYAIQIRARRDLEEVKRFVAGLKEKGIDAHWATVNIEGKGVWHRVFIGHFAAEKDAVKYMKEKGIDKSYPGSWVLKSTS